MQSEKEWFHVQLRAVLNGLYNPQLLRKNPLVVLLKLEEKRNPSFELQSVLLDAIESLRPGERAPTQSEAWRLYQILRRRYTEQVPQNQVAADLSLSIRQLQREESNARGELGDYLYKEYDLAGRISTFRGSCCSAGALEPSHCGFSRAGSREFAEAAREWRCGKMNRLAARCKALDCLRIHSDSGLQPRPGPTAAALIGE